MQERARNSTAGGAVLVKHSIGYHYLAEPYKSSVYSEPYKSSVLVFYFILALPGKHIHVHVQHLQAN